MKKSLLLLLMFCPFILYGQSGVIGQNFNSRNGLLNGLVGYWTLNETGTPTTYTDSTGNGWTGTKQNTVNPSTGCLNGGQSTLVNGSGGITISSSIDTRVSTTPFSITCWVKTGGTGNGQALIGEWGTRNDWVIFNGSGSTLQLRTSDDSGTSTDTGTINPGTSSACHHIVVVWDGTHTTLYMDTVAATQGSPVNVRRGGGSFTLLNYQTLSVSFAGTINEVGYYNVALTTANIAVLYNNGSPLPFRAFTN